MLVNILKKQLLSIISPIPKVAAIEQRILAELDSDQTIEQHQHLKILWYKNRLKKVLQGAYEDLMPVNIELVPSLDCNLHCPHCTYITWKKITAFDENRRKMPAKNINHLLNTIEEADIKGVTITGGGEPFVNTHIIEFLENAAERKFDTGIFTNGSLLTKEKIQRIARLNLDFIRISVNSAEKNSYLEFHGIKNPHVFEQTIKNIELLGRELAECDSKTAYGLAVVVNEVNVNHMISVAKLVRQCYEANDKFKLDYITYRPVVNYGQIHESLNKQISPHIAQEAINNFHLAQEILCGFPVVLKNAADYFDYTSQATEPIKREYINCIGHAWCASVAYDGGVYLCSERNGQPNYLMGNLMHSTFAEIWGSTKRKKVIEHINNCPPACKIHRTNLLLYYLFAGEVLTNNEISELDRFLDVLRSFGRPDKLSFLSW